MTKERLNPECLNIDELVAVLQGINARRLERALKGWPPHPTDDKMEQRIEQLFQPSQSLAVYGTLVPGASNAGMMAAIAGTWQTGQVRGHRYQNSAGAAVGYPGMVWDMTASPQSVHLFQSVDLPQHWLRLDEFEGDGYVRILVPVEIPIEQRTSSQLIRSINANTSQILSPNFSPAFTQDVQSDSSAYMATLETIQLMAIANLYALRPASIPA